MEKNSHDTPDKQMVFENKYCRHHFLKKDRVFPIENIVFQNKLKKKFDEILTNAIKVNDSITCDITNFIETIIIKKNSNM